MVQSLPMTDCFTVFFNLWYLSTSLFFFLNIFNVYLIVSQSLDSVNCISMVCLKYFFIYCILYKLTVKLIDLMCFRLELFSFCCCFCFLTLLHWWCVFPSWEKQCLRVFLFVTFIRGYKMVVQFYHSFFIHLLKYRENSPHQLFGYFAIQPG